MQSPVAKVLRDAANALSGISDTPRLDAELLMAHASTMSRSDLLLRQSELHVPPIFSELLARRMADEPVAYITGYRDFWDLRLAVTANVLIPRADSETLIEAAIEAFSGRDGPARILDLGTGSGALLLAALSVFEGAHGIAMDASTAALAVAKRNADSLGFHHRAEFIHLNWRGAEWTTGLGGPFDLILCNPPYVEDHASLAPMVIDHEPHCALFAGPDGLEDYRIVIPAIPMLLAEGGVAVFEIGFTQTQAVCDLAADAGLAAEMRRDLAGNPRCIRFSLGIGERDS